MIPLIEAEFFFPTDTDLTGVRHEQKRAFDSPTFRTTENLMSHRCRVGQCVSVKRVFFSAHQMHDIDVLAGIHLWPPGYYTTTLYEVYHKGTPARGFRAGGKARHHAGDVRINLGCAEAGH